MSRYRTGTQVYSLLLPVAEEVSIINGLAWIFWDTFWATDSIPCDCMAVSRVEGIVITRY